MVVWVVVVVDLLGYQNAVGKYIDHIRSMAFLLEKELLILYQGDN